MQEQTYPHERIKVGREQHDRLAQSQGARTFRDSDTNQDIVEVPTPIYRAERRRMQREERKRQEREYRAALRASRGQR
jgi:hypothetical protein